MKYHEKYFASRNYNLRFYYKNLRFSILQNKNLVSNCLQHWNVTWKERRLWCHLMLPVVLLNSFYKGEERIKALIQTNTIQEGYIESVKTGEVRGYLHMQKTEQNSVNSSNAIHGSICKNIIEEIGQGKMEIQKVLYGARQPYKTIVSCTGDLVHDWQSFYDISEQIPSWINFAMSERGEGYGILIQEMPKQSSSYDDNDYGLEKETLQLMRSSLGKLDIAKNIQLLEENSMKTYIELLLDHFIRKEHGSKKQDSIQEIVNRILDKSQVTPIQYYCRCSRMNYINKLNDISNEQLLDWYGTEDRLEITCQFCNETYTITKKEVQ